MTRGRPGRSIVAAVLGLLLGLGAVAGPLTAIAHADLPVPTGANGDPVAVRDKAHEILAQPEYQPPPKSIGEQIQEKLQQILGDVFNALAGGGQGSIFGWLIISALIGVVVFLVVKFGRGVQRTAQQGAEVTVEVRRTPTEWRAEAARLEAAGQWKEALRCRYRAMVSDLVQRKVVPDIPGRTVGEHRADVGSVVPTAAPSFDGAAELFEQAWYGSRATGPDENARFRALSDAVVEEADR